MALSLIETQLANLELLKQIEEHLFLIVIAAFFVSGSENIVKLITSKNESIIPPSYTDPFLRTPDDTNTNRQAE